MFLGVGRFMSMLAMYRIVWIKGHVGGGKTSLALFLAQWLVEHHYVAYVASNTPIVGAVQPHQFPVPFEHSAIIIDEAALYLDSWSVAKKYLAFVRKFNHFIIMPSVWSVSPRLRVLTVKRSWNLYPLGVPAWIYSWRLMDDDDQTKGYFTLLFPHRVFGMYSTKFVPPDDGGIAEAIQATMRYYGFKRGRLGLEKQEVSETEGQFSELQDYSDAVEQTANRIERATKKFKRY